ncbi:MAG: patatin-like phospholipase family protein [Candidatus Nitrosocosmicus sp.]
MSNQQKNNLEKVLILQGGGSLGAFGCGVYKSIASQGFVLDIIAGTSIGGINAAIIAGSRDEDNAAQKLEEFWIELSEGFVPNKNMSELYYENFEKFYRNIIFPLPSMNPSPDHQDLKREQKIKYDQIQSFSSSALFGNSKFFMPRWLVAKEPMDSGFLNPAKWTYIYDHRPLLKTLEAYIDFEKLNPQSDNKMRLILTAVNVLNSRPLIFDSKQMQIKPKHILATSAYPLYNFPWIEVETDVYAWDGGLLSNTPLREVLDASPIKDKVIFLVENYPKRVKKLPGNLGEVYHRARDIIFSDKTEHSIKMSATITRYLDFIEELYQIVNTNMDKLQLDEKTITKINRKYKKYHQDHGAEIKEIFYISRDEEFPHIFENADFSPKTISRSIREGAEKTLKVIEDHGIRVKSR